MLVEHIDYDPDIWEWNAVNTTNGTYERNGIDFTNDHQRITIFHANNSETTYYEAMPLTLTMVMTV